ncbi:hypothetical protein [Hyphomonas johnsonii]|uniref:NADH dehydrogenase subunit E n=1 Tax=Hyphomonas johnsonii MHS-2 TaxID=1280950 RepID=A0A059FJ12_9PROT|nr:hypothetical protein [Hyphomonas johnsonii]KCZ90655.1 hypothetical protein HJO_12426 [Hyphomonas johnsonii MHS-2]
MLFLLTQIFVLLLLAAVLGAGLAYWWMKNRYEDITESHAQLTEQLEAMNARPHAVTRDELDAGVGLLSSAISGLPEPDLSPLMERVAAVEAAVGAIHVPETDLSGLEGKLGEIETGLAAPRPDVDAVQARLADVEGALSGLSASLAALEQVEARLVKIEEGLNGIRIPEVDLGPLHSGLARLDLTIAGLDRPETDLAPVQGQIGSMDTRLAALSDSLTALSGGMAALKPADLGPLEQRLVRVEQMISNFIIPEPNFQPLLGRLAMLEESIGALRNAQPPAPDLAPVERRLAGLQEAFLTQAPPDLSPVLYAVETMEGRLDLEAVENRLNAIEYGLAAIHHTLKARSEPAVQRTEREVTVRTAPLSTPRTERVVATAPLAKPPRDADPINEARREDDEANLLVEAAFGDADDLEKIIGVGPMLGELLNEIGVYYFWQIAEWTPEDVKWVDSKLMHFKGRIQRDNWVGQAQKLAAAPGAAARPV